MAAKKMNAKRAERIARSNARLNRALSLFTVGFVAEFYLLLVHNYLIKGTMPQVAAAAQFLEVVVYIGLALVALGIAAVCLREKKPRFAACSGWLLSLGVFLTVSSGLMLKIYPAGTIAMCILVPVLMLLSVVFLLYQPEFAVQAAALSATIACCAMLGKEISTALLALLVRFGSAAVAVVILLALVLVLRLKKNGGVLSIGTNSVALLPENTNYTMLCGVLALCVVLLAAAFAGFSYYTVWGASAVLFILAVWYTVKIL